MLSASSPIAFPKSSLAPKRAIPHEQAPLKPKPRVNGPFILDDDESENEYQEAQDDSRVAKRRMLQHPAELDDTSLSIQTDDKTESDDTYQTAAAQAADILATDVTSVWSSQHALLSDLHLEASSPSTYTVRTCRGNSATIKQRTASSVISYEAMVAARSRTKEGRAKRSYYGIEIHDLINEAARELANKPLTPTEPDAPVMSIEAPPTGKKPKKTLLWTEKYRARTFMDLCGDDGTNRHVLRWLKRWDPVVFPGQAKAKPVIARRAGAKHHLDEEKPHRKILMLTGAPGLGKTTLAHVCAKQAGYEVLEVNASDDRSRDVVRNRIRTSLGTESVKKVANRKESDGSQKVAKPVCVIVDEVDGVTSGAGASGEGGFVKALMDLVLTDQRNSLPSTTEPGHRKKKKGDDFRQMRPLVLICNDVYHPSLRPLRQSNLAEIVHAGRPSLDAVVSRVKHILDKEGIPCDKDAARKLCEAAWGMTSGIDAKRGAESTVEGDLRGVMVVAEWVAGRFRCSPGGANQRLTRQWIENKILRDLSSSAAGARGLGRGNVRDIVQRLFQEGGGFPKQAMDLSGSKTQHEQPRAELGFGEQQKKHAMDRLRQMVDTSGEVGTIVTEIFAEYPNREFNDDMYLSKPNQAYDWLHFHDACQSRLYASQEWELAPYLSQPVLACHHLFASPKKHYTAAGSFDRRRAGMDAEEADGPPAPFSGPRADFQAREAEKQNRTQLQALQSQLSPTLVRSFRSVEDVTTELLPYLIRLVSPDVKPVVVGGSQGMMASVRRESEKKMVQRASQVLAELGIALQKGQVQGEAVAGRGPQFVYRMEPDLDSLSTFETGVSLVPPTRYAVRQVLDQELRRTIALRHSTARQARFQAGGPSSQVQVQVPHDDKENRPAARDRPGVLVKRDFFGRIVEAKPLSELDGNDGARDSTERKVWVTYHEGLNNAVRKPISLREFLRGM
ncbi:ATPase, AAA-type, core [Metarhizium rileyi]|uniref:ATPase, AAA-type, core n=1 Tax=Metarhizium rileyi (strain RCEF 4871) TaxID=1649241 RepID=A0A167EV37_METRR|nr:ATPase, AAA-type, core [Metarhizium rileyi RCEF 4871]